MQFKVKDIGDEGVEVDVALTPVWLGRECAGIDVTPGVEGLAFRGRLEISGSDYLLRGQLVGSLVTPCARCLESATLPLAVDVSVVYTEVDDPDEVEEDDTLDAPDVLTFSGGVSDLTAELRDELLLALPPSPLCGEECAGLCPVCGGQRNATPCDCAERERARSGKFAVLAKLKS